MVKFKKSKIIVRIFIDNKKMIIIECFIKIYKYIFNKEISKIIYLNIMDKERRYIKDFTSWKSWKCILIVI